VRSGGVLAVQELTTGRKPLLFEGHESPVTGLGFGARITSIDSSGILKVWDALTGRHLHTIVEMSTPDKTHQMWMCDEPMVSFSADANRVVAVNVASDARQRQQTGCVLKLWDIPRSRYRKWETRIDWLMSVVLSPDGGRIAAARDDLTILVFEFDTLKKVLEFKVPEGPSPHLSFSPDGSRLVTGAGMVRVWDATSGRLLQALQGPRKPVRKVGFPPGHLRIACGGDFGVVGPAPPPGSQPTLSSLEVWDAI
jgi:WD40 repeat protein